MLKYKVLRGTKNLQLPCKNVESIDEGLQIVDKLDESLQGQNGIGLAANQIGINKRVCIIRVPLTDKEGKQNVFGSNFINPVITHLEEPILFPNEGCLSFPNIFIKTLRYNRVTVVDLLEPSGRTFEGLQAVVAQHEIDHTNGKTMYDSQHKRVGNSDTCPCGSGLRFKKCCKPLLKDFRGQNDKV